MDTFLETQNILGIPALPDTNGQTTELPSDEQCVMAQEAPFPVGLMLTGLLLVALFVGIFTAWSALVPIESAVVAKGIISAGGHRKVVQHLEGGIIEAVLVQNGEPVTQGQVLIKLRDVHPKSELRQFERQSDEAQAVIARLLAERDEAEEVAYPPVLTERLQEPSVASIIAGQNNVFKTRRNLFEDKKRVMERKVEQKKAEIKGYKGRILTKSNEKRLLNEELTSINKALARQAVSKVDSLRLQQRLAQIENDLITYQAEIKRLDQSILEIRVQMNEARARHISDITEELRSRRAQLYDLAQKILAAQDVLRRTEILSPTTGIVVNLHVHTTDGVIKGGEPLLEVVPTSGEFVVNAYVAPSDIDEVEAGMATDIRLTSLSRRYLRVPIPGVVVDVSADRITDPQDKDGYYLARIELDPDSDALENTKLVAGMGADVFIRTAARTPLEYLLAPIIRSLELGLKEQ